MCSAGRGQVWRPVRLWCEHGSEVSALSNPMTQGVSHLCVCTNMHVFFFLCVEQKYFVFNRFFSQQPFLTGHCRVNTGVIDYMNYGPVLFSDAECTISVPWPT